MLPNIPPFDVTITRACEKFMTSLSNPFESVDNIRVTLFKVRLTHRESTCPLIPPADLAPIAATTKQAGGLVIVVQHSDMVRGAEGDQRLGGMLQIEDKTVRAKFSMHPQKLRAAVGDGNLQDYFN